MTCTRAFLGGLVLAGVLLGCLGCPPPQGTELVTSDTDWRVQDFWDSRGVTSVEYQGGELVLTAHLVAQHEELASGEILLDFLTYAPTEGAIPIDMTGCTIRVEVVLPPGETV